MKNLRYLNKFFVKYKWLLISGFVFVVLSNFFRVKMPQAIRDALDLVLNSIQDYKLVEGTIAGDQQLELIYVGILKYAGFVILFAALMGVFMYFMRQTVIVMSRLIEYDIRKEMFAKYEELDTAFFKMNKTGDLMSRISEDVSKVRMYLGPGVLYGMNLSSLVILVVYAMFQVNATLTFYTLLPLPFLSFSIYLVSDLMKTKSEQIQIQLSKLTSVAQEVYSGIRIVKSYVSESRFQKMFAEENEVFKSKSLELAKVNALFHPLMILLISISTLLTVVIGAWHVKNGQATPGNIAEFVIYVNMLSWPVASVGWIASIVQQAEASQKRINEFIQTEPKVTNDANAIKVKHHEIEFDEVSFVYENTGISALNNVSFKLKPGQKMAILGRTAAGKTTIAELLLRMYDVSSGQIRIGGRPIQGIDLDHLRKQIAYVPQDLFLFSDSVENNIKFGLKDAPISKVKEYASYAAVAGDIEGLPEQYDTLVGERGVSLSGGQKQRITLARALIKEPEIVILDDCLSAVDTDTEQKILNHLNHELKDKTVVLITHRIHSLLNFDKIIVLDQGEVVEEGTHVELMENEGLYADMFEQQILIKQSN